MKRLVSAFLAGAMALSLAACGGSASTSTAASSAAASAAPASSAAADSDLAYIRSNGKMVIGYTVYEPMNYTDADGNFTGFDTELATAVCGKLGVEPEFVEINWDTKETDYTSTADLIGKTVVAEAGSAGETTITENADLSQADFISKAVQTDCLMEVAAGTADAAVLDLTLASAMIGEGTDYANLKMVDELNVEEYGVAFRKGSDVAEAVDNAFDELKADGTMQTLADKYGLTLAE